MVKTGLANALVTGLVTGSIIALGAIGLSLIYSIAEVPNFAHGELLTIGAYMALFVNRPHTVPVFELFTTDPHEISTLGMAILFVLTVVPFVGIIYHLGGKEAIMGSWLPWDVNEYVGYAITGALSVIVGGIVLLSTPSIWGGLIMSAIIMAAFSPLLEKWVFRQFRNKGVDLATMLIVALGLSFVLRYGLQALYSSDFR
ncbi:MAG: branched-chain amino acid ABC transporter permease, partial [Halobacteriaceae archaeon]